MSIISLLRLGEWVKVFNDTFCIVYLALIYDCWRPHWYLQPFISILFQFYHHVGQFYCLEKRSTRRKPSSCRKSLNKCIIYSCIEYTLSWAGFKLLALVVASTDCTCIGKSHYQMMTITTSPWFLLTNVCCEMCT